MDHNHSIHRYVMGMVACCVLALSGSAQAQNTRADLLAFYPDLHFQFAQLQSLLSSIGADLDGGFSLYGHIPSAVSQLEPLDARHDALLSLYNSRRVHLDSVFGFIGNFPEPPTSDQFMTGQAMITDVYVGHAGLRTNSLTLQTDVQQTLAVLPEPATLSLLGLAGLGLLRRRAAR